MIIVYRIIEWIKQCTDKGKHWKDNRLKPFVQFLKEKMGISSNFLTLMSFICGITAAYFLFKNNYFFSVFIILSMLFDLLDGGLARLEKKEGTTEGWIIDMASDRLVMIAVLAKSIFVLEFKLIIPITILYIIMEGLLVYERLIIKRKLKYIHGDWLLFLLCIWGLYEWGLYALLAHLILDVIFVIPQLAKKTKEEATYANLISFFRPILVVFALLFFKNQPVTLALLIVVIILLDALDGIVARRIDTHGELGAYVDIAADRAVELIILFTYAYWGLIHYIFPILFTLRGVATDFLRILNNIYKDERFKEPLSIGKADNRWIRGFYGFIKLAAFSVILILHTTGYVFMIIALIINLYRGIPVIFSKRSKILLKKFL